MTPHEEPGAALRLTDMRHGPPRVPADGAGNPIHQVFSLYYRTFAVLNVLAPCVRGTGGSPRPWLMALLGFALFAA